MREPFDIVAWLREAGSDEWNGNMLNKAAAEIDRLRRALERTQIGVNHIATYRTSLWPDYGSDHELALAILGAGREYDMWCCWNAAMCARDSLGAQDLSAGNK